MDREATLALIPLAALALVVIAQFALAHAKPERTWRSIAIASAVGMAFAIAATAVTAARLPARDLAAYLAVNAGATIALAFGYANLVNLNYTSLRVRMLRELSAAGRSLTLDELKRRYSAEAVLDLRLQRLVATGELRSSDGVTFFLGESRKVLLIGRVLKILKSIVIPAG